MQNIIKYTRYFKDIDSVDKFTASNFFSYFEKFDVYYKSNTPTQPFGHLQWGYKSQKYRPLYNNILIIYADYLGVKVMFKDLLDDFERPIKGYYFIGDIDRIVIMRDIWEYTLGLLISYKSYAWMLSKGEKLKRGLNRTNTTSIIFSAFINNIAKLVKQLLVTDIRYTQYLETHILNSFKLDFRKYRTDDFLYYNAISKKYHNKRMLQ